MKFKVFTLLLISSFASLAYGNGDSDIYLTGIKNTSNVEVYKFPTSLPTASKVAIYDGSSVPAASSVTLTTLGYLDATSSIQTQMNGKQASVSFIDSVTNSAGSVSLVNDSVSPGNSLCYSTNSSGVKGWHTCASGGSGITSINTDVTAAQVVAVGSSGTDFAIVDNGTGTHTLNLPVASATNTGKLSNTDWSTFNSKQSTLTIGNLTDAGTDGLTVTGGTASIIGSGVSLSQHVADTTHNGYLASADWNTFNNKGSGTVTAVSVASTHGFTGSSSGGSTPAITISTSVTGLVKGDGTSLSAATLGTDYSAGTSALTTGILKSTTTTGGLTIAVAGDFPTLNQNTTGSAAKWTTARNLAGNSVDGSANATFANKFIVQGTTDAGLSAAQFLGALSTGIVKNTTTTGVLSIATSGDFPTLNQNTTGTAASWTTARNLAGNSVDGSANVAFSNKFIVQGTTDAGLSSAQFLGALATGIVKNTTTTGALTIAVAGDFPTLNQSTTGSAGSLSSTFTSGVPLFGQGTGVPTLGTVSGNTTKVVTTTGALTTNDCVKIDASGNFIDAGGACGGTGSSPSIGGTITSGTAGSILYVNPTATFAQDNANFFWDGTNHRLGIGNAAPLSDMEVTESGTSTVRGILNGQYSTGTNGAKLLLRKARGTRASPTVITSGDNLGLVMGEGYDGTNYLQDASIIFGTEGTIATGRVPTTIRFQTATDAATSVVTEAMRINSAQRVLVGTTTDDGTNLVQVNGTMKVSGIVTLSTPLTGSNIETNLREQNITFTIDGGGNTITTGISGDSGTMSYSGTIQEATILCDQTGSIVLDIWKQAYSSYPPTVSQSITSATPVTVTASNKADDSTLASWTTTFAVKDDFRYNVVSASGVNRCVLTLKTLRD